MPSLPNSPDPSSSPSAHYSRHSHAFLEGSYRHNAHADCKQVSLSRSGPLHTVILARVVPSSEGKREDSWGLLFEDILCRWGGVAEIVTYNGPAFVAVAGYLSEKYGIHHIKISPYNSQANGIVECKHFDMSPS